MIPHVTPTAGGWVNAGPVASCPPGASVQLRTDRFRVAVFHLAQGFVAIKDHCPHQDVSLSRGSIANGVLTCPAHSWAFDLRSGQCVARGPADCALRTFQVEIRDGVIFVKVRH